MAQFLLSLSRNTAYTFGSLDGLNGTFSNLSTILLVLPVDLPPLLKDCVLRHQKNQRVGQSEWSCIDARAQIVWHGNAFLVTMMFES